MKKTKQLKQVKAFSVDGEIYTFVVERLKEAGETNFTVSSLVNDYLGYLHYWISSILAVYEKRKFDIDRAWAINEIIKDVYDSPNKLFPMDDPWVKEHQESAVNWQARCIYEKYLSEKNKLLNRPVLNRLIYGTCDQCKYNHGGICSIKNSSVGYMERCERFRPHPSIKPKELNIGITGVKQKKVKAGNKDGSNKP